MTDHNDISDKESIENNLISNELISGKGPFTRLSEDDDFIRFNELYQKGEWDQSEALLTQLIDRYPDDQQIVKYMQDIKMQRSLIRRIYWAGKRGWQRVAQMGQIAQSSWMQAVHPMQPFGDRQLEAVGLGSCQCLRARIHINPLKRRKDLGVDM